MPLSPGVASAGTAAEIGYSPAASISNLAVLYQRVEEDSLGVINSLAVEDPHVRYVSLSRNFGRQVGLFAGTARARGDAVIAMNGDQKRPPALTPDTGDGQAVAAGMRGLGTPEDLERFIKVKGLG